MEKRLGAIIILINDKRAIPRLNRILSDHSDVISGRLGIPFHDEGLSVITIVIKGTTDDVGALTGQIGRLDGIQVKSALVKS